MGWPSRGKFSPDLFRLEEDPWDSKTLGEEKRIFGLRQKYEDNVIQASLRHEALLNYIEEQVRHICISRKREKRPQSVSTCIKILDVAPGSGSLSLALAKQGHSVTVCNPSLVIGALFTRNAAKENVPIEKVFRDSLAEPQPGRIRDLGHLSHRLMHQLVQERYDLILLLGAEVNQILSMDSLNRLFVLLQSRCQPDGKLLFDALKRTWFAHQKEEPNRSMETDFESSLLPVPEKYKQGSSAVAFTNSTYLHRLTSRQTNHAELEIDTFVRDWSFNHLQFAMQKTGWSTPRPANLKLPFEAHLNLFESSNGPGFRLDYPRFYESFLNWFQKKEIPETDYSFIFHGKRFEALVRGSNSHAAFLVRFKSPQVMMPIYLSISESGHLVFYWWQIESGDDNNPSYMWATKDFGPDGDADIHLVPFEWADPLYGEKPTGNKEGWLTRVMDDKDLEKAMDDLITQLRKKDILTRIKEIQS